MDRVIHTGFSGEVIRENSILGLRKRPCRGPEAAMRSARLGNRGDAGPPACERGCLGGEEAGRVGRHQVRPGLEIWILSPVLLKARGGF